MLELEPIITMVFRTYGFGTIRTIPSERYLLVEKEGVRLSIGYGAMDMEPDLRDLLNFIANANNDRADRSIFISSGGFSQEVKALEKEKKVQLWEKDHLEKEIGRAVLNSYSSGNGFDPNQFSSPPSGGILKGGPSSVIRDVGDDLTPERAESLGMIVPTLELARQFNRNNNEGEGGETGPLDIGQGVDEILLKPKLTLDEALSISKRELSNVQCKLQYIPYLVYDYSCNVPSSDATGMEVAKGVLAINALTNDVYEWNEKIETQLTLEDQDLKLPGRIQEDQARSRVLKAIVEINTRTVEAVDNSDSVTIIEKKKVQPKPDAISLDKRYTAFLPVWCAEGNNGQMIIDATSGEVVRST